MSASVQRYSVVLAAFVLIVLLFFAPHKPSSTETTSVGPVTTIDAPVKLDAQQQKMFEGLQLALDRSATDADKQKALEALAQFFEQNKKPVQVALYYQKLAELKNTSAAWFEAGERFYRATGFAEDAQVSAVYENAIAAYSKALAMDKNNVQAQIKMGVCYVELGSDPMKGIGLIREVADKDPKNIDAQLNLGFFAVKSKQYDKAIIRFTNVLKIDSGYVDANVYLANTYEMMGDTNNALTWYEAYRTRVTDTVISNEVGNYIKKLKGNKNIKN